RTPTVKPATSSGVVICTRYKQTALGNCSPTQTWTATARIGCTSGSARPSSTRAKRRAIWVRNCSRMPPCS
ncbi:hypothetical protein, partial [Sporisorium scitamineum]